MMALKIVKILWIAFFMLGQGTLFILLCTLLFVRSLRARQNPFLINLLVVTFLSTFPPTLLFITGHSNNNSPKKLCLTQAALMDGLFPMITVAFTMLILKTWADIRTAVSHKRCLTTRFPWLKWVMLLGPYSTLLSWSMASLAAALLEPANMQQIELVYCANNTVTGQRVRDGVGFFVLGVGFIVVFFELWICRLINMHSPGSAQRVSTEMYHANYHLAVRIFVFSVLSVAPILLSLLETLQLVTHNFLPRIKLATQIAKSLVPFATFLVFGTQREVLCAWLFCQGRTKSAQATTLVGTGCGDEPEFDILKSDIH